MKETNFEYSVASDTDYEDLIADIGFENNLVALLTQEDGFENLRIRIFLPKDMDFWDFRFDEFNSIIHRAKERLSQLRKKKDCV